MSRPFLFATPPIQARPPRDLRPRLHANRFPVVQRALRQDVTSCCLYGIGTTGCAAWHPYRPPSGPRWYSCHRAGSGAHPSEFILGEKTVHPRSVCSAEICLSVPSSTAQKPRDCAGLLATGTAGREGRAEVDAPSSRTRASQQSALLAAQLLSVIQPSGHCAAPKHSYVNA